MLTKRIIPCLDIKDGRTVKGVNFVELRDAGNPIDLAARYVEEGADELVFLDITATVENRATLQHLVREVAREINIPFTVGGGINTVQDASILLNAGADKVSINSSAVRNPQLVDEMALQFGSQFVVVAMDIRQITTDWLVHTHGGRTPTSLEALSWATEVWNRGAGEILLTSMNHDGTKAGFACEITATLSKALSIPVIASGGAGNQEHFKEVFTIGCADAALAASIFHFGEVPIPQLKAYLQQEGIPVRNLN